MSQFIHTPTLKISTKFEKFLPELQQASEQMRLKLTHHQLYQLLYYLQQLLFWNKAYNLTAIKEAKQALIKHIFDSLAIVRYLPVGNLLDVGTGAGLPAVIVAICQPNRQIVALDSNQKKIRFIKQMVSEIGLNNIQPIASRIEEHDNKYQIITSRAFASLVDFVQLTQDKLTENGEIWAMKGVLPQDEICKLTPHWQINSFELFVPTLHEQRHLICLKSKII